MIGLDYGVWLVTRAEWGARAPRSVTGLAAGKVTSHWEGPHMGWPWDHNLCAGKVRGIQNFHMDGRGWSDIAYNALACGHGYVFEGRGPGVRSAANGTTAGNNGAYAICSLTGQDDAFTDDGERAMKAGGNWLTFAGSARNCHRDWKPTECPGAVICNWTHDGQPITWGSPPQPSKDWFDMATKEELEAVVRAQGPWLAKVYGDPDHAVFIVHGGIRTWIATGGALAEVAFHDNVHTNNGNPFTPNPDAARGFFLINRAELEAHIGHPYEF